MTTRPRKPAPGTPAPGKLPLPELAEMKRRGDRIVMVTAYDAPSGRIADDAGVDLILVGDSAAMVVLGHDSTVPATIDEMIILTRAVEPRRPPAARDRRPAVRLVPGQRRAGARDGDPVRQGGGADAVKLEGAGPMLSRVRALTSAGIPVMGHIGLTPQTATMLGGFKAQGRNAAKAVQLYEDALALEAAGCFAIVLEAVPGPGRDPHHRGAGDPDDRHRRRRRLRRPGARLARPARPLRRQGAALREAVRRARADDPRRGRPVRRRGARRRVPGGEAHVRDGGRRARAVRGRARGGADGPAGR